MAGTIFGIGTSPTYPLSTPWGFSPYGAYPGQAAGVQSWQQLLQLLQIVPQQLQQVHALQQQQLLYVQQLLQIVPAQLQQLQQLIQVVPQQVQPLGQNMAAPLGFGLIPQTFGGQLPVHVM